MFGIKWQPFKNPTKVAFQPGKMTLMDALSSAMSLTAPGANPLDIAKWSTGNLAKAMGVDNLGKMNLGEAMNLAGALQGGGQAGGIQGLGQLLQGQGGQGLSSDMIAAILGGAGMLARPETPQYVRDAMKSVSDQKPMIDSARKMAMNYDPVKEDQAAIDLATREAGRALSIGRADMSQRYANAGGTPGLSTNYLYNQQQATDSVLNPLTRFIAERRSGDTQRRIGMLGAGSAIGSNYAQDMTAVGRLVPTRDTNAAAQMLAQGLNALTGQQQPGTGNQQSGAKSENPIYDNGGMIHPDYADKYRQKRLTLAQNGIAGGSSTPNATGSIAYDVRKAAGLPAIKLNAAPRKASGVTPLKRVKIRQIGNKIARYF